jgi:hypothetical protein
VGAGDGVAVGSGLAVLAARGWRVEHRRKLGNTPDMEERVGSHRGGLSVVKRFGGGQMTAFHRWWNSGGRRRPPGGSAARGGEGECEG